MTRTNLRTALTAALVATATATACGSTVGTAGAGGAALAGDGLSAGVPTRGGAAGASGDAPPVAGARAGDGSGRQSPASQVATSPQNGRSLPTSTTPAATGSIKVGVPYVDQQQTNTFLNTLGGSGLTAGDTKTAYQLRVDELNQRGGVLGRKVQAVFYRIDASSSQSAYESGACAYFTQDQKVSYVFEMGMGPNFTQCMVRAGIGMINTGMAKMTTRGFAATPGFLDPVAIALDRLVKVEAERFLAMGYFDDLKTTRVGILYYDHPEFAAAEKVLEQQLAAHGITVAARQAVHYVAQTSDVAQTSQESQGAVLKFQTSGVTHVLAVEENAWLTGFFGIAAASQHYYPRYGYTSNEPMGNIASNVPHDELKRAVFIGWNPVQDVADAKDLTPKARTCLAFFATRGLAEDTPNERGLYLAACEGVDMLASALTAAGDANGASSLVRGARLMTFVSTVTFGVRFSDHRSDGAVRVRDGMWDGACACFRYTSKPYAI